MSKLAKGIDLCLSWVPAENGSLPKGALDASDGKEGKVFIGRANHNGLMIPGTVRAGETSIALAHDKVALTLPNYQVLIDSHLGDKPLPIEWKSESKGKIPKNALVAGLDADGKALYLARNIFDGEMTVGKVCEGQDRGYFPHQGEERFSYNYDILTIKI